MLRETSEADAVETRQGAAGDQSNLRASEPLIPSPALSLTVNILGMEFRVVFDIGSGLSLIEDAVYVRCRAKSVNLKKTNAHLQLVSGARLPAEAVVRLYMRFAEKRADSILRICRA